MSGVPDPFGQPQQLSLGQGTAAKAGPTFGQPPVDFGRQAVFGTPSTQNGNTFGQVQQSDPSTFGQPQMNQSPAFGQSQGQAQAFGQQPQGLIPSFGQQQQPAAPTFGQPTAPGAGFGQAQPTTINGFGNSPIFGQQPDNSISQGLVQQVPSTAFSQPPENISTNNGFGQISNLAPPGNGMGQSNANSAQSSFGQSTGMLTQSNFGNHNLGGSFATDSGSSGQDLSSYTTRDPNTNRLLTWKSQPVIYLETGEPCFRRPNGALERIWFPDGPPEKFQQDDLGNISYNGNEAEAYRFLRDQGAFEGGVMPETAPGPHDIRWDV